MIKGSRPNVVLFLVLMTMFIGVGALCAFDSYDEKVKAYEMAYTLSDLNARRTLIRNIVIGNITTLDQVRSSIDSLVDRSTEYYGSIEGLNGDSFRKGLSKLINKHDCLGYSAARQVMYKDIDNQSNAVECVYTGRMFSYQHGFAGDTLNSEEILEESSARNKAFLNCEHSWPQSFFNKKEPMRSDIFHLFPTDSDANSIRGSYPFGEVEDVDWEEGGSKRGSDSRGKTVFEPRDSHKGNVARALFYFSTCYSDKLDSAQEETLRKWHELDPVDDAERERNEEIYKVQKNRNPFIDHPEWVAKITDF